MSIAIQTAYTTPVQVQIVARVWIFKLVKSAKKEFWVEILFISLVSLGFNMLALIIDWALIGNLTLLGAHVFDTKTVILSIEF